MLSGRLGLAKARIPHADRHGLLYLERGRLVVVDGCLRFVAAKSESLDAGAYPIAHQTVSAILLGPGTTISHDALRITARHGTGVLAVGTHGVRMYASLSPGKDESKLARLQAEAWADKKGRRVFIARHMYQIRFGEVLPSRDLDSLRGLEGVRVKKMYEALAKKWRVPWKRREYDRQNPSSADLINQAINHATTAVQAAAEVAVAATSTIPQLGFIHENSSRAWALDIADLFRDSVALPVAFEAASTYPDRPRKRDGIERVTRRLAGERLHSHRVVAEMITRIKELLHDDNRHNA